MRLTYLRDRQTNELWVTGGKLVEPSRRPEAVLGESELPTSFTVHDQCYRASIRISNFDIARHQKSPLLSCIVLPLIAVRVSI